MSTGRICTRTVVTASARESVLEVARRMEEHGVGTVVVVDENAKPVGIVTDRDLVLRCIAAELEPAGTRVSEVMTREVRTVDESTPIEQALRTMAGAGTRRLVVTGTGGKLAGLLSMDDFVELLAEEATSLGEIVRNDRPAIASRGG
jgi:CBS domain-containing protein